MTSWRTAAELLQVQVPQGQAPMPSLHGTNQIIVLVHDAVRPYASPTVTRTFGLCIIRQRRQAPACSVLVHLEACRQHHRRQRSQRQQS